MKSKKAEEYLNRVYKPGNNSRTEKAYNRNTVDKAIELAEKEMKEKATEEFRHFLEDYCHEAGIKMKDTEHYIEVFTNELNK